MINVLKVRKEDGFKSFIGNIQMVECEECGTVVIGNNVCSCECTCECGGFKNPDDAFCEACLAEAEEISNQDYEEQNRDRI